MKRPKQLPAVDRNKSTKSAAVPKGANVSPSGIFDDIVHAVTSTAPVWAPALAGLI
jgi:hypothetical protein